MERNTLIIIVIILIIGVGAVVGIWLIGQPAPEEEEMVIIFGTTDTVEASIDPAQSYDYFGWEIITSLGQGLVEIEPGSEATADDIQAALATDWERAPDGKSWTFPLREDLKFYDDQPFNATCVKWSFERNIGMALEDGPQLNMGYGDIIDEVVVVSEYEVRFDLKIAFTPFLQLMACAASYIVHPDFKDDTNYVAYSETAGPRGSHPNDLGPFVLANWTRVGGTDTVMRLEKNEKYWGYPDYPKADVIIIQFYETDTALASAMSSGALDVAYRHLTPAQIDNFKANEDFEVYEGIGAAIQYMLFQQRIEPWDEEPIRQAVAAALNRTNLAYTVFQDTVDPLYSMIPKGMAYHKDSFKIYGDANYTFTVDTLADYGYDADNKLVIDLWYESSGHYPSSEAQATVYKSDLDASGVITVNLHSAEWPTYREQRNAGSMPVFIYGWYPDYIDPDNYAFLPFASWLNLGFNDTVGGVEQAELWTQGRSVPADEREAIYFELQDLQAEQCSCIPLWQGQTNCVATPNVKGIVLDITVNWRHWLLYLE